jgi:hypothetical protein
MLLQRLVGRALVVEGVVRVERMRLQHLVQVLDLGERLLLWVRATRRTLAIVDLRIVRWGRIQWCVVVCGRWVAHDGLVENDELHCRR